MSYAYPYWVSSYTYSALAERVRLISSWDHRSDGKSLSRGSTLRAIIDEHGHVRWSQSRGAEGVVVARHVVEHRVAVSVMARLVSVRGSPIVSRSVVPTEEAKGDDVHDRRHSIDEPDQRELCLHGLARDHEDDRAVEVEIADEEYEPDSAQ